ncbi:hypothetical protein HK104_003572 [Borealophlyctis nickersoniae]|nr:hypothetical protein HK104_003572 [Borealophlyctis nickersoniae]
MPTIEINTNVTVANTDEFGKAVSKQCAELLKKPESYMSVIIKDKLPLLFAGSSDPAAIVHVYCIGNLGLDENKTFSAEFSKTLMTHLQVKSDRYYIFFHDVARQDVGHRGATFATF